MINGNRMAATLYASSVICALLFAQSIIPSAQAQQSSILILDHEGQAAGQIEVLCDNAATTTGQCGNNQEIIIRYHASEGRDLEIREDLDCPSCLSGPARFQDPSGDNLDCTGIDYPVLIKSGSTFEISSESCGVDLPLRAGPWSFTSDVLGFSEPVVAFFDVSFFVLPESPIGAIALMSSSLAMLGGFLYFRQRRTNISF
ncbi:MAG: hypothetical protein ACRD99_04210 [Nitrososphaera sp.]